MVRQSPERAYDIAFFDEFARAAGWTERLSLENPELPRTTDRSARRAPTAGQTDWYFRLEPAHG